MKTATKESYDTSVALIQAELDKETMQEKITELKERVSNLREMVTTYRQQIERFDRVPAN
jgi:phosphopantetheine adenylyltransferase